MYYIFKIVFVMFGVTCAYIIHKCLETPPIPELENTWWGDGSPSEENATIKPFKLHVQDEILRDLQRRLENTRPFPNSLEGTQHQYGINSKLLQEILDFWMTKYNWREREIFFNQFPQYTIQVQGLKLHYIHVKPPKKDNIRVLPLLMLHGWPTSIRDYYEIIPILTTPRENVDFVFEVIAPSLPGFGFSEAAKYPGLGSAQMAVLFKNFMGRLGFKKYYVQGSDWGSSIAQSMATLFPEKLTGIHLTMCASFAIISQIKIMLAEYFPQLIVRKEHEHKIYPRMNILKFYLEESGYLHIQSTKPDTLGIALNDSPVGLAAYILDKYIVFTNPDFRNKENGGLEEKFSYTSLIDNLMIYWITGTITSSMRIYAENFNKNQWMLRIQSIPTSVPTVCTRFSEELFYQPDAILKDKFSNLVHTSDYEGGHFATLENPKILADDLFFGFKKIESDSAL